MKKLHASILAAALAALGFVGGMFSDEEIVCAPGEAVAPEVPE